MPDPKVLAISSLSVMLVETLKVFSDWLAVLLQLVIAVLTIIYLIKKIRRK